VMRLGGLTPRSAIITYRRSTKGPRCRDATNHIDSKGRFSKVDQAIVAKKKKPELKHSGQSLGAACPSGSTTLTSRRKKRSPQATRQLYIDIMAALSKANRYNLQKQNWTSVEFVAIATQYTTSRERF